MNKTLPPRPNLDHLRRQAKALLAALAAGDAEAVTTFQKHLPAAQGMSAAQVRSAKFRLADAQSAVARQTGFGSWPQLARHVEQLRGMEGTWEFVSLEIDGSTVPPAGLSASRLLIDGDRFRTQSPEATYEGVFNIDVEKDPHGIDIEFVAGPEAGNWNYGIFRIPAEGKLEICLDVNGKDRPRGFRTSAGSGHALETLRRASTARPEAVKGGTPSANGGTEASGSQSGCTDTPAGGSGVAVGFAYAPSPKLTRLQGEWTPLKVVRDGQELPAMMLSTGRRSAKENEVKISFGGQVIIHALVRLDEAADLVGVDYCLQAGPMKGVIQHGIMRWRGEVACFCMAAPGQPRPGDFECPAGSGRTLSEWKLKG